MIYKYFDLKLKEKPEDFIVKEIASHEKGENFYLYLLIKRDYNLFDIKNFFVKKGLDFSFAGIKDKKALTFQYISVDKFLGEKYFSKDLKIKLKEKKPWFLLKFLGKIKKKIKPGHLMGNRFFIKTEIEKINLKDEFINYYDIQRLEDNWKDGLKILLEKNKKEKDLIKKIKIDAFLSFIWNKSLEKYLLTLFDGYFLIDKDFKFFIPNFNEINKEIPKYWPILGYNTVKKLKEEEKEFYKESLEEFGIDLETIKNKLKLLKIKGDYRKIIVKVKEVKIINNYINFFLPKGSYATMYLKFCYKI